MPSHQGPKSEEYEKLLRFAKKIGNGENERETRFKNMDKLRDYAVKDSETRNQLAENSRSLFNLIGKCLYEGSRKLAKEASELIIELTLIIFENNDQSADEPFRWVGAQLASNDMEKAGNFNNINFNLGPRFLNIFM